MDIEQLKTFVSLAENRHFTRTAEEMNIVQSTVTARIKLLEEALGKQLFIRQTRDVEITSEGQTFLTYAQQILELLDEGIKTTLAQPRFNENIVIGGMNSLWDTQILDKIHRYQSEHPKTALRLITGHSEDIIEKIGYGLIDVGFVYNPPHSSKYNVYTVQEEPIHLVGASHIVHEIESLQPEQIKELSYIHYNWGREFSEWFESEIGQHEAMRYRVDHSGVALKILRTGKGIGFMLESIIKDDVEEGRLKRIPLRSKIELPKQHVYMVLNRKKHEKIGTFIQHMIDGY